MIQYENVLLYLHFGEDILAGIFFKLPLAEVLSYFYPNF